MSLKGIDFATLSLRDALDLAILIEEEAKDRYEELAQQMELHHTAEAASFFRHMVTNELKHGEALAARRAQIFRNEPRSVTRAMLCDIEAPEYDEVRAFMTRRAALNVALRAEQKAHAFFVAAVPQVKDATVRTLFEELRREELEHQRLIEEQLAKLPAGPEEESEDFEDEPVAQ